MDLDKIRDHDLSVTSTPDCVSVRIVDGIWPVGVAASSRIGARGNAIEWYINRIVIRDEKNRGHGVGGKMLSRMIEEIRKYGPAIIIVEPGGYGADPERQVSFYEKNGFMRTGSHFELRLD